jgi:hypothetical protein
VSIIKPANLKALIEGKLDMNMSELEKNCLEFVAFRRKMAITNDEHYVGDHKKTAHSGSKNIGRNNEFGGRSFEHNP